MPDLSRRNLLAAGAAAAVPGALLGQTTTNPPQPKEGEAQPPGDRVGYAIVGLGEYASQQIMPAFREAKRSRLAALVTGDRAKGERLAAEYGLPNGSVYTYDEMAKLRDNPRVQVGYVITPNSTHLQYAEALAKAGKHVLSEKPMEISVEKCRRMIEVTRQAGVKLMIGYRAQYEPFNEECIRLCRSGELGRLRLITSEHGRQLEPEKEKRDTWRAKKALAGGGSLMDIGVYALNASMYLSGEVPVEIDAREDTDRSEPRFAEVEDTIRFNLRFPSGLIANLCSGYSWSETKRYSVIGDKKKLDLDPATDYYRHNLTLTDKRGKSEPSIQEQSQFARQLDHYSQAIQENTPIRTPGEMGLRDVALMMKIYVAARTGRPVKVNPGELR